MIFISFILDGIFSIYFDSLIPLSIIATISVLSYFKKDDVLLKEILIVGILYDVTYTNTIILNSLIFYILYIIAFLYNKKRVKNLLNLILLNIILIIIYLLSTYLILTLYQVVNVNLKYILFDILNSIIFNTFYLVILYYLFHKEEKIA